MLFCLWTCFQQCFCGQPSVHDIYLSKEKQEELTMALYDIFLESSDCVAMHACEQPALKRFCPLAGFRPLQCKVSFCVTPCKTHTLLGFCVQAGL